MVDSVRWIRRVLLILTKIELSSDYKSEEETSTSFILLLYTSSHSTPLLLSPTLINSLPFYYNMSQYGSINLEYLIRQQQEQIVALQVLIAQASLEEEKEAVLS